MAGLGLASIQRSAMRLISSLSEILNEFDVALLDQWGVLHNGRVPYPGAIQALEILKLNGKPVVVLSNSGKRWHVNRCRIADIGLPTTGIDHVVTSGEVAWLNLYSSNVMSGEERPTRFFAISAEPGDPEDWAAGINNVEFVDSAADADYILVMGIPDGCDQNLARGELDIALKRDIPMICTNPDKTSPSGDSIIVSPGAIADGYERRGGTVKWYGKPYGSIYHHVRTLYPNTRPKRFLMVGDSLEHDIAGAKSAGFNSVFVRGGIHLESFSGRMTDHRIIAEINSLSTRFGGCLPDYSLAGLA